MSEHRQLVVPVLIAALAVGFLALTMSCGNLSRFVKVNVPTAMATVTGLATRIPLNEVPRAWERWDFFVRQTSEQFSENVGDSVALYDFLASLTNATVMAMETPAGTLPGGTLLFGMLAGSAGLFLNRPGTSKRNEAERADWERRLRVEKQGSYNRGVNVGRGDI